MDSSRVDRYAYAGALALDVANLLQWTHDLAGGPSRREPPLTDEQAETASAAAATYTAAAACSTLAARLLLRERDAIEREVPDVPRPQHKEIGATAREANEKRALEVDARVQRAALAAVSAARRIWAARGEDNSTIATTLTTLEGRLRDLANRLTDQPDEPASADDVELPPEEPERIVGTA